MRGPRPPDRVPRPARAGRTGCPVAHPAPARGVRPGGREVGHPAGHVQPPDRDRPDPERAAVGHPGARTRHRPRRLIVVRRVSRRRCDADAGRPRRHLLNRTAANVRRNIDNNDGGTFIIVDRVLYGTYFGYVSKKKFFFPFSLRLNADQKIENRFLGSNIVFENRSYGNARAYAQYVWNAIDLKQLQNHKTRKHQKENKYFLIYNENNNQT